MNLTDFAARNPNCLVLSEKPEPEGRNFTYKKIKPEFIEAILRGDKTTTHRPLPKNADSLPDKNLERFLRLSVWSGAAYHSPQIWVCDLRLKELGSFNHFGGEFYRGKHREKFDDVAQRDGFKNYAEMQAWFAKQYKLSGDWEMSVIVWAWSEIVAANSKFLTN